MQENLQVLISYIDSTYLPGFETPHAKVFARFLCHMIRMGADKGVNRAYIELGRK